jgi:hypothetical protein
MKEANKIVKGGGKKIANWKDFIIYITTHKAKKSGKESVWFSIRQNGENKKYGIGSSLAWSKGIDILFTQK